jgi:TonB family protein
MKSCLILAATVAIWLQPMLASDDTAKQQEAIKKIEQAVTHTNIFELPSFEMKASVQIVTQGKLTDGSYQLLWNGPDQWREEIRLPGYTEVQVGGNGTVSIQRSTSFLPLRIYHLHTALGFGSGTLGSGGASGSLVQSGLVPTDKVKKMKQRKEHGEAQMCVEYENEVKRSLDICVSQTTNTIVRSASYLDKDIQPAGSGKVYPRFLSFTEEGKTVARVNITDFTTPTQFPPNSFNPPAGASPQAGCMNPTAPRLTKKVSPQYPDIALRVRIEGTVAVDARIGTDGIPRIGEVVGHANPNLESSSISALKEWRYEPATCNGKPVEVETVLQVNYSLSR